MSAEHESIGAPAPAAAGRPGRTLLDMNAYQDGARRRLAGGFDAFDALLFNFVAPNCVPTLLGLAIGSPAAKSATLLCTGVLTSLLLVGWAAGGILFGQVADRIARVRTLMLTMVLYAVGTAACALAPNLLSERPTPGPVPRPRSRQYLLPRRLFPALLDPGALP